MKKLGTLVVMAALGIGAAQAQGLVHTAASPFAKLSSVALSDVRFTQGFWKERFDVCRQTMVPQLWATYTNKEQSHSFQNFRIAAGLDTGNFRGPSFHDGDFYKTLEALAAMYAQTKDRQLEQWLDSAIAVIGKAQKSDGYIYTKNIIEQKKSGKEKMFDDQLSFEAYNFGHLMTAACIHYRATAKRSLLDIATRAADFLIDFYNAATPEQARNAICPSHYMGLTELYRTTHEQRYLDLVDHLIDIRGTVEGTDDNSDRAPFRKMQKVVGHAVRANYLFAGAADLYSETGDPALMQTLNRMWGNVVGTKMYVTGGCGSLYDGVSVDGTSYKPDTVQKVHQAYGKDFQLPNLSAHNETCANIGNVLWNYRMFLLTGEARYMDIVELALYNSVLSGVSLDGAAYFYTNPLAASASYPYHLRWEGGRVPYIGLSNCCPPNVVRTVAEVSGYCYSVGKDGLYINLYGGNQLDTKLADGSALKMDAVTDYPWNGRIRFAVKEAGPNAQTFHFRIPGWCKQFKLLVNGKAITETAVSGYVAVKRSWKATDQIELILDMPATLIESNPLVEETRNQIVVKRGPMVYCIESSDNNAAVFSIALPAKSNFQTVPMQIGKAQVVGLKTTAQLVQQESWQNTLYRELNTQTKPVTITLIPYYAWANRGRSDMSVWLPLMR